MVRYLFIILTALTLAASAGAQDKESLNGDKLREILRKAEQEHARRQRDLKYDEMHQLYRVTPRKGQGADQDSAGPDRNEKEKGAAPKEQAPPGVRVEAGGYTDGHVEKSTEQDSADPKAGVGGGASAKTAPVSATPATNRVGRYTRDRYVPRPNGTAQSVRGGGFAVDQVTPQGPYFGIRMGTRIRAEIRQPVTNAERNLCEIYIMQDVHGEIEIMPAGTIIFAAKQFNTGTNKLEVSTVKGITPKGEEFKIDAYGKDAMGVAGLSGTITTDGKAGKRSVSRGAFEVSKGMASALNNGTVVGVGVEAATKNLLSEKESETAKQLNQPQFIIRVDPQPVILMVEKTF